MSSTRTTEGPRRGARNVMVAMIVVSVLFLVGWGAYISGGFTAADRKIDEWRCERADGQVRVGAFEEPDDRPLAADRVDLDDGTGRPRVVWHDVPGLDQVESIAGSVALREDGTLWRFDQDGAAQIDLERRVEAVTGGSDGTAPVLALLDDASVALVRLDDSMVPVDGMDDAVDVAMVRDDVLIGLRADGSLLASVVAGDGPTPAAPLAGPEGGAAIEVLGSNLLVEMADGAVSSWPVGYPDRDSGTVDVEGGQLVAGLEGISSVEEPWYGYNDGVVVDAAGAVWWFFPGGEGTRSTRTLWDDVEYTPSVMRVAEWPAVSSVAFGSDQTYGIDRDGDLVTGGSDGALAHGDSEGPVATELAAGITSVEPTAYGVGGELLSICG